MKTELTRRELRVIYTLIAAQRDRDVPALCEKLRRMIAERAGEMAWGQRVFTLTLPLWQKRVITKGKRAGKMVKDSLAPTLNVYGSMKVGQRSALYKALDLRILAELHRWPAAHLHGARVKRGVRVTRRSSQMPDEISVDVIGGKVPVDRLVQAGILAGDTRDDLERDAAWQPAPPDQGQLVIEVYELVAEAPASVAQP